MQNFECIGGPLAGSRLACKFNPYDGAREVLYHFDGEMKREAFYELRRHGTVELITGEGVWQWYYVPPNSAISGISPLITNIKGVNMELPQKNVPISNSDVITLCEQIGGMKWEIEQIKNDPPVKPFFFDGASGCPEWLSKLIEKEALPHDIKYWIGGSESRRLLADKEFREKCKARIALRGVDRVLAQLAYKIVRVGGSDRFDTPWKWGFGR